MAKKVNFNLKHNPGQTDSLILLRLNYNAKRFQISTGITIPTKYWNPKAQRVKETQAYPYYKQINQRLNSLEADTLQLFFDYAAKGIIPSLEKFKEDWQARNNQIQEEESELLPFIKQIIEERKGMNRPTGSIQVYKNCLGHLESYQTAKRKPLTFGSLTQTFLADFTAYLFSKDYSDSYTHKILTTLKMFVRQAEDRGICENCPLLKAKLQVQKREGDNVYLNEVELKYLFNMPLEGRLANVRDLFLIGCLTGLRVSDFSKIKPENIQQIEHLGKTVECVVMTTKKMKQKAILPLVHPMLRAIMERNGWKSPKPISDQKLNDYLKELCQKAGFTQDVEINEYKAGRHERNTYKKWELVTTHTARRSFATNAFKSGLPVASIMSFTGHTTVASFMKYIKVTTEETAVLLSEHEFFTGKPKLKVVS